MVMDYFPATLALDPLSDSIVENAEAEVFALEDTDRLTPLAITDVQGNALTVLQAGPAGIFPAFICPGHTQVVPVVNGSIESPPISSIFGPAIELVGNPTTEVEGRAPVTDGAGAFELRDLFFVEGAAGGRVISQEAYDALVAADELDPETLYFRTP